MSSSMQVPYDFSWARSSRAVSPWWWGFLTGLNVGGGIAVVVMAMTR